MKQNTTSKSQGSPQRAEILASIKRHVFNHHINVAGVDYDAWARHVDEKAPSLLVAETDDFENGLRDLLGELGTSHTVLYHESTNRLLPQHSIGATLRSFELEGGPHWVFLDVFDESPASVTAIKPGTVLVAVNGIRCPPPTTPPLRLGQTFSLTVSDIDGRHRRDVTIDVPYRKGTKSRPPIIEPKSITHRLIAPGIGVLKIPYFPGSMGLRFARDLDVALANLKEQRCDRLIVDLRGNIGGGLGFARLASYMCPEKQPIGYSLTRSRLRKGYLREKLPRVPMPQSTVGLAFTLGRFAFRDKSVHLLTQGLGPQPFHGKIVLLVNEWTNSAAEMLANFGAENKLATIVGTRTAGNVLGAVNFSVGSGYWLRLPIFGWYTPQGHCLEKEGVSPDVAVEVDLSLLSAGVDPQMEKAIGILR